MQVVCRQQNLDTTEDNRNSENTFTHRFIECGQQKYIYNLSNYFSTADSSNKYTLQKLQLPPTENIRNKYDLQKLHLPPTAESKLHLYLTESRTLFTTHRGQQNFISNVISEFNLLAQTKLSDKQLNTTWTKTKLARQTHIDYTLK
jgi:hypothetical protein